MKITAFIKVKVKSMCKYKVIYKHYQVISTVTHHLVCN